MTSGSLLLANTAKIDLDGIQERYDRTMAIWSDVSEDVVDRCARRESDVLAVLR